MMQSVCSGFDLSYSGEAKRVPAESLEDNMNEDSDMSIDFVKPESLVELYHIESEFDVKSETEAIRAGEDDETLEASWKDACELVNKLQTSVEDVNTPLVPVKRRGGTPSTFQYPPPFIPLPIIPVSKVYTRKTKNKSPSIFLLEQSLSQQCSSKESIVKPVDMEAAKCEPEVPPDPVLLLDPRCECPLCFEQLASPDAVRLHMESSFHSDIKGPLDCSGCAKPLRSIRDVRAHQLLHSARHLYKCSKCNTRYVDVEAVRRKLAFFCPDCFPLYNFIRNVTCEPIPPAVDTSLQIQTIRKVVVNEEPELNFESRIFSNYNKDKNSPAFEFILHKVNINGEDYVINPMSRTKKRIDSSTNQAENVKQSSASESTNVKSYEKKQRPIQNPCQKKPDNMALKDRTTHTNSSTLPCVHCQLELTTKQDLLNHKKRHNASFIYQCPSCCLKVRTFYDVDRVDLFCKTCIPLYTLTQRFPGVEFSKPVNAVIMPRSLGLGKPKYAADNIDYVPPTSPEDIQIPQVYSFEESVVEDKPIPPRPFPLFYKCGFCKNEFPSRWHRNGHMMGCNVQPTKIESSEKKRRNFRCVACRECFDSLEDITTHVKRHKSSATSDEAETLPCERTEPSCSGSEGLVNDVDKSEKDDETMRKPVNSLRSFRPQFRSAKFVQENE